MTQHQDAAVTGSGNTVVQIVGDGNAVSIGGARALRLVRYDQAGFTSAPVKPGKEGEPGFTETGRRETAVLSAFNRESLPFQGRKALLDSLTAWRDGTDPVSVHAITGGGGRGKTRLALRLVDEAVAAGWIAGFVRKDDLNLFTQQGCPTIWKAPTLVVVDYVAAKSAQLRNWMHMLATEDLEKRPPLRVLLLERIGQGASWWRELFEEAGAEGELVQDLLAPDAPQELRAFDDPAERHAVFAAAYAAASGRTAPAASEALDHALREASLGGEPLFLAMFGLVAARQGLEVAKAYPADRIAKDLAREELKRIGKVWEARGLPVLADRPLHAHLAAAVSLTEGLTEAEAHGVIAEESKSLYQAIPAGQTATAFGALREALEGEDGGIAPILPDILGEAAAVVALGALPDKGVGVIERLSEVKREAVTASVVRACQDFLIRGDALPMAWLEALRAQAVDIGALAALANAIPENTLELREISAEVIQRILDLARALPDRDGALICASALNNLSNRLSALGRREEALAAIVETVEIRRSLAASRPDAFLPDLAVSLNNLSSSFSDLGRREEALCASEEAVETYRSLARTCRDVFLPDLALSLNNISVDLSALGRLEEALTAIEESVDTYRSLAASRSGSFLPNLAMSLHTLSNRLSDLGGREEALTAIEEAVEIRRSLAASRPDAFLPDLALSLNNLSVRFSDLGRWEEALMASEEALETNRSLAAARPDVFLPDLAVSLNTLSIRLFNLGRWEETLAASEKSVATFRCLATTRPDAFLPDLAMSLGTLSQIYAGLDRHGDAVCVVAEAITLLTPRAKLLPQAFAGLGGALLKDYHRVCQAAATEPDEAIYGPLDKVLQSFIS